MRVPKGVLRIAECSAAEPTRYSFHGIQLSRDKTGRATAAATDGRRLVVASWDESLLGSGPNLMGEADAPNPDFKKLIPAKVAKRADSAAKAVRGKKGRTTAPAVIHVDEKAGDGKVALVAGDQEGGIVRWEVPECGTQFPPYDDVVPRHKIVKATCQPGRVNPAVRIGVKADLLIGLLEAMIAATPGGNDGSVVTFEIPMDPTRPLKIVRGSEERGEASVTAFGVLMPCNTAWRTEAKAVEIEPKPATIPA